MLTLILLLFASSAPLFSSLEIIEATYGAFRNITKQVERSMKKHGKPSELAVPLWAVKRLDREEAETQNVFDILYVKNDNTLQRVLIKSDDAHDPECSEDIPSTEKDANEILKKHHGDKKSYLVLTDLPPVKHILRARIGSGAWVDATDDIAGNVQGDTLEYRISHKTYEEDLLAYEDDGDDEDTSTGAEDDEEQEPTIISYAKQAVAYVGKAVSSFFNNNRMMVVYEYNGEYSVAQAQQGSKLYIPKNVRNKKKKSNTKKFTPAPVSEDVISITDKKEAVENAANTQQ